VSASEVPRAASTAVEADGNSAGFAGNDVDRVVAEMAELAGGLAHELRNPLSTILIQLKLLTEDVEDRTVPVEDMRRRALLKIDLLRRESVRLQDLFDEFLNLAGPCRLRRMRTDLADIVRRLAEFVEPGALQANIRVEADLPGGPVTCLVDEQLISQALLNLILNAQQAMPQGGRLRLSVRVENGGAEIRVSDTGVGIAPQEHERVFRPFFSTKPRGTGLGLPIARRIVREHGGDLSFESAVGRGTTFVVRLPDADAGRYNPS